MRFPAILMAAASRGGGLDVDALAWAAASGASGAYLNTVSAFISAEKASGCWALTDDYWALWAPNATQALTSLKQRRLATVTNAPTFTADRGYTFDGSTNYINVGFIPSTHAVAMTGSNLRLAVYERTNVQASAYTAGCFRSSTRNMSLITRSGGGVTQGALNSDAGAGVAASDSRGLTVGQRNGSTYTVFKNGVSAGTWTPTSNGTTLSDVALFIGCQNANGTPGGFKAASVGLVAVGASLTADQNLAQYNNGQAFATAVGANV